MDKRHSLKFILCEDVRNEASGKLMLTGVYPGDSIKLVQNVATPPPGTIAVLPRLAIAIFVKAGYDAHAQIHATIKAPSGQELLSSTMGDGELMKGQAATLILQGGAFVVPGLGTYKVEIKLNDEVHEFAFDIQAGENFEAAKPIAKVEGRVQRPRRVTSGRVSKRGTKG
jgi:hypothetical protein